jgi:hypothetical protein
LTESVKSLLQAVQGKVAVDTGTGFGRMKGPGIIGTGAKFPVAAERTFFWTLLTTGMILY